MQSAAPLNHMFSRHRERIMVFPHILAVGVACWIGARNVWVKAAEATDTPILKYGWSRVPFAQLKQPCTHREETPE